MSNLVISFSGGRTSAFMSYLLLNSEKYKSYNKEFVLPIQAKRTRRP